MRRIHYAVIALLFLVPAGSRLFGSGTLAWTMYARAGEFRMVIVAHEREGRWVYVAPTALAPKVAPSIDSWFAGSDHFRGGFWIGPLKDNLASVARLACDEGSFDRVSIKLEERADETAPVRETSAESACP